MPGTKKTIIRVGDVIRIVNPRFIKRVGYPIVWTEIADEVEKSEKCWQAYCTMTGQNPGPTGLGTDWPLYPKRKIPRYFVQACAKLEVEQRGWGGDERTIHYWKSDDPMWKGHQGWFEDASHFTDRDIVVQGKRLAKTGTRYPPSGGYSGWEYPEYYEEPGGLENEKTHVILKIWGDYEIEDIDVQLVRRANGSKET
jgi:hypothetical protein